MIFDDGRSPISLEDTAILRRKRLLQEGQHRMVFTYDWRDPYWAITPYAKWKKYTLMTHRLFTERCCVDATSTYSTLRLWKACVFLYLVSRYMRPEWPLA